MTNYNTIDTVLDGLKIKRHGFTAKVVKTCLQKKDREMFIAALEVPADNRVPIQGVFDAVQMMAGVSSSGTSYIDEMDGDVDITSDDYTTSADDFGKMNVTSGTVADCIAAVRASGKFKVGE